MNRERKYGLISGEDRCRAVALMNVAVDNSSAANRPIALKSSNCYGDVVQYAEPGAMVGKGMMRAAGEIRCYAVLQSPLRRQQSPSDGEERSAYQCFRPGQSQPAQLARRQFSRTQTRHIILIMNQQHVGWVGRRGLYKLPRLQRPFGKQTVAHQLELANRKDMGLANVGVIPRSVGDAHLLADHSAVDGGTPFQKPRGAITRQNRWKAGIMAALVVSVSYQVCSD